SVKVFCRSDLLLLHVPLASAERIGDNQHGQQAGANTPEFEQVRVGAAEQAIVDPFDSDPDQQRDAGKNFVEDQPTAPSDQEITQASEDAPADGTAPSVE